MAGSWPAAMTHAVHPHQLVLLRYNRNSSCDLCGGHLAGKLGYRCEPCDFDVHCTCLPTNNTGTTTSSLTRRTSSAPPPPPPPPHNGHAHAHAHPPPRVSSPCHHAAPGAGAHAPHHHHHAHPQPSVIYAPAAAAATGRPQLNLSLSAQFSHQLGAQTSPVISPAPSNHGYYRPRPDYGAPYPHSYDHLQQQNYQNTNNQQGDYGAPYPHSYDHLQQQNYQNTNNQQGGYDVPDQQSFDYLQQQNYPIAYHHDYTGTRDSGDVDDYNDPLDDMDDY